ncbi:hypothetical protein HMPREF9080_00314 [Cardiobacterium valvarum F0432]|uniref:Uncharacterized protein n=1 Tax=Cardiobacterium valvarum F0432 TaxID=797473 RepID=G9ZC37_9GAMM|nr:hypothetical protein HMPREF9080_00314 [Cardiobacterium valvarum F0432]
MAHHDHTRRCHIRHIHKQARCPVLGREIARITLRGKKPPDTASSAARQAENAPSAATDTANTSAANSAGAHTFKENFINGYLKNSAKLRGKRAKKEA